MKVAISTDNGGVSAHFGRCPHFTLIDIEEGKVMKEELIENPGHQPGLIPKFLYDQGVNCIVAGGMGKRAVDFFHQYEINTIVGIQGKISEIVNEIIKGTLEGGESLCQPGVGKGYGLDKTVCDHPHEDSHGHQIGGE